MKNRPLSRLADEILPFIAASGYSQPVDPVWVEKMLVTLTERAKTLIELVEMGHFYLSEEISIDEKAAKKLLTNEIAQPLKMLTQRLANLSEFNERQIEKAFTEVLNEKGLALGKLAQPIRVALTGSTASPGIYEVIAVLGKERTLKRLNRALEYIEAGKR